MIYKKVLILALSTITATAAANKDNLRGVISLASDGEEKSASRSSGGNFSNECLRGRFSYWNLAGDVASISVAVFDGAGTVTEMENILIDHPDPENGGRAETSLPFQHGTYEVYPNGLGVMRISLGSPGGPFYDPPALDKFVVTGTSGNGCEITAMNSFLSSEAEDGHNNDVGVAHQLVAPRFNKIADA